MLLCIKAKKRLVVTLPVFPVLFQQWQRDQEQLDNLRAQRFVEWLQRKGLNESDRANVADMQRSDLHYLTEIESMPDHVFQAMNAWSIARGDGPMSDALLPNEEETRRAIWYRYLMGLTSQVLSSSVEHGEHISSSIGQGLLRKEAITLVNTYYLDSGDWSPHQYKTAQAFVEEIATLNIINIGEASGYSMAVEGTVLKVCYSTFDSETYKSEDFCDRVDLDAYPPD